jgi:sulfur-oxidizing protein SoxY
MLKTLIMGLAVLVLAAQPTRAQQETDADRAARWQELRHAVYGDRTMQDGSDVIVLEAPVRALDAALVPVTVTLNGPEQVTTLAILIDGNPSPLAATFHFGPAANPHVLKTHVRVDRYTLIHAVAETADHRLFVAERFVKAAGGCSAPLIQDAKLAQARLGQIRLRVEDQPAGGGVATAQLVISHPNANGMQMDQLTRQYIPARFIQEIKVSYGGALVFDVDADISLSEDPNITFGFRQGAGSLTVDVLDSTQAKFSRSFDVPASGS